MFKSVLETERAELVSEMKPIKHDNEHGVVARKGIES